MSETSAVIFDMDGVIVHSNPAHKKAIQMFCDNHNQEVSQAFMENRLFGRTNAEWIPELFGALEPVRLKKLADEKEQLFRDIFIPEDNVVKGIHSFLELLKEKNIPIAVATSAPSENADYILSRLSIMHFFDALLNSSHVSKGKPDPEVYLKTAKALNKDPQHCIVFEDSVSGVKAGLAAGCTVVGITTTHAQEELGSCSAFMDDFSEYQLKKVMPLIKS